MVDTVLKDKGEKER